MAKQQLLLLFFFLMYSLSVFGLNFVKIGGIFCNEDNSKELLAFNLGVEYVNNDTTLLPNTDLVPLINETDWSNSFSNVDATYWQIQSGAVAIVGPITSSTVKVTQPLCAGFHIPQLAPYATDPTFDFSPNSYGYLLRMSSSDAIENRAMVDFVSHFKWTNLALLTSRNDFGLNGLVVFKDIASHKGWTFLAVESFQEFRNASKVNATKQLLHIRSRGARIVVVNCMASNLRAILLQASDLGMIDGWVWLVTNGAFAFDGLYDNERPIPRYLQGIVGIRNSFGASAEYEKFKRMWEGKGYDKAPLERDSTVGHVFDSVMVLAKAIHNMLEDGRNVTSSKGLKFGADKGEEPSFSEIGATLLDYITKVNTSGVIDRKVFGTNRSPFEAKFDIVNLRSYGFETVGRWDSINGLAMDKKKEIIWSSGKTTAPLDTPVSLENRTITVVTIVEKPFIERTSSTGKPSFQGYCIDLLEELKKVLKFSYEINLVPDNNYGSQDAISKEWNGMVKELIEGRADIAVAPFTVSSERQKVIDFTQPYMDLGLTALVKSVNDEVKYYTFFKPFHLHLWLVILAATCAIGVLIWLFSTFSPYGFYGRCLSIAHRKIPKEYEKRKHTLRLTNAIWSSVMYYVGKSSDSLHPVSASGRITVTVWWFAIGILLSAYTANLAAFLTIKRFSSPLSSMEDLAGQEIIFYGTVKNSQPQAFFEASPIPTFVTMWQFMKYHHTLVADSDKGISRVKGSNFAFIWDSIILEHVVHSTEPCGSLTTIGKLFGKIGYGIGLPKGSQYTKQLSQVILRLRQEGFMDRLEQKWLHTHEDCIMAQKHIDIDSGTQLGLNDMAGVFIILGVGVVVSLVVLALEWVLASHFTKDKNDPHAPNTLWEALKTRRRSTLEDLKHRDDVPRIPWSTGGQMSIRMRQIGSFMAGFSLGRKRGEVIPEILEVRSVEDKSESEESCNEGSIIQEV
ncbi:glutamate receptor ionotropic, kainate 2-like [Stylophora pistillata]|uniref:glutamate receptor ionotropic, kainate 2-like n=1 Tax=Stylophora pistillata TaxID=50429 RepID=UPI000C042AEE|nr:glutamate receptor ionotropic, kainate 2-like [Stylophora pistillata]